MSASDFGPIPNGATGPPPPDYGASGENKNDRAAPGGDLGKKKDNGGGDIGGPGPVIGHDEPIEPDPVEPNYSADKWDYIHYAASRADQYPSEMRSRISTGNIDAHTDVTQYSPLHIGVKFGQVEAVRQLIAARARTESRDILGQTPLALACCYDVGIEIPRMLLDADADPEHVDKYSWKPIFWAARKGKLDVVKLLLARGARKSDKDKRGQRPRDVAATPEIRALLA